MWTRVLPHNNDAETLWLNKTVYFTLLVARLSVIQLWDRASNSRFILYLYVWACGNHLHTRSTKVRYYVEDCG